MIPIALIDDHPLAVNGIGAWLCGTGRFTIAGTAGTLDEARSLMERLENLPLIIILDISLGKEDGLKFIPELKGLCGKRNVKMPGILVCSMYEDPFLIQRAIDSGAGAYVAKSAEAGEIITAIDAILAGSVYVNPKYRLEPHKGTWMALSRRENEIVSLIKQSLSTRQIAKRLSLSVRTVENHLAHIYVKTGVQSRAELFEL
jgi:NarL family two-component system response regulator LiaR